MTSNEACIVAAHTGCILSNLDQIEFHKYVEKILNKRVTTEDLQTKKVWLAMQAASTADFASMKVTKNKQRLIEGDGLGLNKERLK